MTSSGSGYRRGDLTPGEAGDRRHFRRAYLLANPYEFFVAVAALISGIAFFADPHALRESAVADAGGWIAVAWALMYFIGGLLLIIGLTVPHPRAELAGLSLFGSATIIDAVALFAERGAAGYRVAFVYLAFAAASALRAFMVLTLTRARGGG